jgi:hypothetical protein
MAQFIVPPPLTKIEPIFVSATGQPFQHGSTWSTWNTPANVDALQAVLPYYRPCHQKLINELLTYPTQPPLALLRQLLRPYDYAIERKGTAGWQLVRETHVVRSAKGCEITW